MNVDRHAELFGARQQRRKFRIVEESVTNCAADQRTLEIILGDSALKLVGSGLWYTRSKMRKRGKAIRPLGDLPRKLVIEFFANSTASLSSNWSALGVM